MRQAVTEIDPGNIRWNDFSFSIIIIYIYIYTLHGVFLWLLLHEFSVAIDTRIYGYAEFASYVGKGPSYPISNNNIYQ